MSSVSINQLYDNYLQQSFFLTKIALKIFQNKFPIDFTMVIKALLLT